MALVSPGTLIECENCGIDRPQEDIKDSVCSGYAVCGDYDTGTAFRCDCCQKWFSFDEHHDDEDSVVRCDDCHTDAVNEGHIGRDY